jgi:D-serine deaminase-like pyridoxal phosphate-dependent protein
MDMAYSTVNLPFKNSLFVRSTIVSKNKFGVTLDVGAKSFGLDQCYPKLLELPDHEVMISEEHFTVFGNDIPYEVGDQLTFVPGHCCTTVNLFDKMFVKQGNEIIDQYIIEGRGKSQ